jgi:hypothetical protein
MWHAPKPNAWGRRLVLGIAAPLTRTGCARISTGLRISSSRAAGTTTPTITLSCYRSRKYTLARGLRQSGQPSDHQTRHARSLWAGSGVLILGAGSQSCLGLKRTVQRLSSSSLSPIRLLLLGIAHLPSLLRVESKRVPPTAPCIEPGHSSKLARSDVYATWTFLRTIFREPSQCEVQSAPSPRCS